MRAFINGLGRIDFSHTRTLPCLRFNKKRPINNMTYEAVMNMYYLSKCFKNVGVVMRVSYKKAIKHEYVNSVSCLKDG